MEHYDPESGQVFTEIRKKALKIGAPWDKRHSGRILQNRACPQGAHSLEKTATYCLLNNLDSLDVHALENIPSLILHRIWKSIERSRLESLRTWKLFATVGLFDRSDVHHTPTSTESYTLQNLGYYIEQTVSPSCAWLTTLTLINPDYGQEQFIVISKLVNLNSLHISTDAGQPSVVSDRVVRAWSEAGTLTRLRLLFLKGQTEVGRWSFRYFSALPALELVCLYQCGVRGNQAGDAREYGWLRSHDGFAHFVAARRQQQSYETWTSLVETYFQHRRDLLPQHVDNEPVLHVRLCQNAYHDTVDLTRVFAFHRVSSRPQEGLAVDRTVDGGQAARPASPSSSPARKRRKIRDGQTRDVLGAFLP